MANQTPQNWQCHKCGSGPQLCATTKRCTGVLANNTQCGHEMCPLCETDVNIPPPTPSGGQRSSSTPVHTIQFHTTPQVVPRMAPTPRNHGRRGLYHCPPLRLNSKPPLRGWWICSICDYKNNPALCGGHCTNCNHAKCSSCRPWTR